MPKKKDDAAPEKSVMDVSRPGKTPPADNSKSVIVTSRPIMKDPMVVKVTDGTEDQPAPKTKSSTKAVIQPLGADDSEKPAAEDAPAPPKADSKKDKLDEGKTVAQLAAEATARRQKDSDNSKDDTATETAEEPKKENPPKPEIKPLEDKPVTEEKPAEEEKPTEIKPEAPVEEPVPDEEKPPTEAEAKKTKDIKAKDQQAKEDSIQKLVDSKKYELPIITSEKRRSRKVVALGILISLLLAAAWVNVALDANLLEIDGIKPMTNFF